MDKMIAKKKWRTHSKHAGRRGVRPLTFDEYAEKIVSAGIQPTQIGRTHGAYQLARYSDVGDYTVKSCRFITQLENLAERASNGGTERGASKNRGKTKEDTVWLAERAARYAGRTAQTHEYVARLAEQKGRPFKFIHETGAIMEGKNLRRFCRENGMVGLRPSLNRLRNGTRDEYRGWRRASDSSQ